MFKLGSDRYWSFIRYWILASWSHLTQAALWPQCLCGESNVKKRRMVELEDRGRILGIIALADNCMCDRVNRWMCQWKEWPIDGWMKNVEADTLCSLVLTFLLLRRQCYFVYHPPFWAFQIWRIDLVSGWRIKVGQRERERDGGCKKGWYHGITESKEVDSAVEGKIQPNSSQ